MRKCHVWRGPIKWIRFNPSLFSLYWRLLSFSLSVYFFFSWPSTIVASFKNPVSAQATSRLQEYFFSKKISSGSNSVQIGYNLHSGTTKNVRFSRVTIVLLNIVLNRIKQKNLNNTLSNVKIYITLQFKIKVHTMRLRLV
jgi:hypothetical protein